MEGKSIRSGKETKTAMIRMAMASFTPISYFEEMTMNELDECAEIISG